MKHEPALTGTPTVNVVNILRVADAIERHEVVGLGFNMREFVSRYDLDRSGRDCGTTACIGGWAQTLMAGGTLHEIDVINTDTEIHDIYEWLGLDKIRGHNLFFMSGARLHFDDVDAAQAVRTLRHLAATGDVVWGLPAA